MVEFKLFTTYVVDNLLGIELLAIDTTESDYALFAIELEGWKVRYFDLFWLRQFIVDFTTWFFG